MARSLLDHLGSAVFRFRTMEQRESVNMQGRSSPRVKVRDIPATIRRKGFPFTLGKAEPARVVDIGPKGLSLSCESTLVPDTRLALTVIIPDKRTIKCSGTVRNIRKSDKGYLLGIEFTKLSSKDREYLTTNILEIAEVDVLETCRMLKDRIRGLRTVLELTVSELSDLTGVPHDRIVQIEYGMEKTPPKDILESLAAGLGVSLDNLLGDDPYTEEGPEVEVLPTRYAV